MAKSDKSRKKKAQKKPKNKPHKSKLGKELNDLHLACRTMLSEGSEILKLVFNKELVVAGDSEKIENVTTVLSKDILAMRERLDDIRSRQPVNINLDNDLMACLSIGAEYNQWIETYQQTIVPSVVSLNDLYLEANKNLNGEQPSDVEQSVSEEQ